MVNKLPISITYGFSFKSKYGKELDVEKFSFYVYYYFFFSLSFSHLSEVVKIDLIDIRSTFKLFFSYNHEKKNQHCT